MSKELKITISGRPKQGKTTVAHIIQRSLFTHGISSTINDQEEERGVASDSYHRRVESLVKAELQVTIYIVMANR